MSGNWMWRNLLTVDLPMRMAQHDPSHGNGVQLVTDGDMEASGVASWLAGNSATLTKQVGTRTGGVGSQVLRIARNGVNNPYAYRNIGMTVGRQYRAAGWARSDGSAPPQFGDGVVTAWTGTTSTSWQYFDVVFTAGNLWCLMAAMTSVGTEYVEFDDVRVELLQSQTLNVGRLGSEGPQLVVDGSMEASGVGAWTAVNGGCLLSKQGGALFGDQCIRVEKGGASNYPGAGQSILTIGQKYRAQGYARGDGTVTPYIYTGLTPWLGVPQTGWQYFDVVFTPTVTQITFSANCLAGGIGNYVEFDNVSVREVPTNAVLADGYTAASMPTKLTHLPGYSFDGGDYLALPSIDMSQWSLLFVASCNSFAGAATYFRLFSVDGFDFDLAVFNTNGLLYYYDGAWNAVVAFSLEQKHTVCVTYDTTQVLTYLDGLLVRTDVGGGRALSGVSRIGRAVDNTAGWPGEIYYAGIADFAMTRTQALQFHREQMKGLHRL